MNKKNKIITRALLSSPGISVASALASILAHLALGLALHEHPIGTSARGVLDVELRDQLPVPVPRANGHSGGSPVLLANEGGADTIKHGAEARFLHGLATEEFEEANYLGTFFWQGSPIAIEQDVHGHLWLHDMAHHFRRRLHPFNRFIYVYGPDDDHPEPVHGSVTFFSDGERIFQFLWQEGGRRALAPRR